MTKWQPIETAPKNGSMILACLNYKDGYSREIFPIQWTGKPDFPWHFCWHHDCRACAEDVPTHWMLLPEPPQ